MNAQIDATESEEPRFQAGDVVHYTNPQGVEWGPRTVLSEDTSPDRPGYPQRRYYLTPTDTPWYSVAEDCLSEPPTVDNEHGPRIRGPGM
jgi:hypothetical protein